MSFLSLLAALLIEQFRPLPYRYLVHVPLGCLAAFLESRFNAGERRHGIVAWSIGVGGLVLLTGGMAVILNGISPLLAWLWNVVVLYLSMGFRQFGHYYSRIELALRMDDLPQARKILAEWQGRSADELSPSAVAQAALGLILRAAHRHLLAVMICFLLLPGPCGAVLYRAAALLADSWGARDSAEYGNFGSFARQSFAIIDWLPLRVTAACFAIVGDFEDAVYCWRTQVDKGSADKLAIVVASGAGALGVRLDTSVVDTAESADRGEFVPGDDANVDSMESAVGLIWRALVLCLLLSLLLGLAGLAGG